MTVRVGLTGGVASGKSTVSAILAELGAVVIDADVLAREVVASGTPGLEAVVAEFGDDVLTERLGGRGVATWNTPTGGYFVNLDVVPGTASRVVALAKEAGVALTPAGSSFPYKQDPDDTNIRLAPTMPPLAEVTDAMEAVATCVLLAAAEQAAQQAA